MTTEFIERQIISGLLMSDEYNLYINEKLYPEMFQSQVSKRVVSWIKKFYSKYKKAPKSDIVGIYDDELKRIPEEQQTELADILNSISDEYNEQQFNVDYLVDKTNKYIKERTLLLLSDKIKSDVISGNITDAEYKVAKYLDPTVSNDSSGDLDNPELFKASFAETEKPLFSFPGHLGLFLNDVFLPDSFVLVQAPQKRGKTFFLNDVAMTAIRNGCTVAYFQCGDLSEKQFIRRLGIYTAQKSNNPYYCNERYAPFVDCVNNFCGSCPHKKSNVAICESESMIPTDKDAFIEQVKIPDYWQPCRDCVKHIKVVNQKTDYKPVVGWRKIEATTPLTGEEAYNSTVNFLKNSTGKLKYSIHPMNTLTVSMIESQLEIWERKYSFIPQIIIIDYFEILFDKYAKDEYNKQHNLGMQLRNLSQVRHCCVVAGTQAMASAREKEMQDELDSSECKKKDGHITAKITLNQTDDDKINGIIRVGKLFVRDGEPADGCVVMTSDLNKGRIRTGSFYKKFEKKEKKDKKGSKDE